MTVARRVVLIGSECTGKTELAGWLAESLRVPWSAEYAREYAEVHGGSAALTADDVEPIARGQLALEERARAEAGESGAALVVHDTDLLSTVIYATGYYGPAAVPRWVSEAAAARMPELYLLCAADLPWEHDAVRDAAADRRGMHLRFADAVARTGVRTCTIRGDRAARRASALAAVRRVVSRPGAGS